MVSVNKLTFAFWVSPPLTSMPSPLCACGQRRLMHVTFFWCGSWARQHDRGHSWSHQKPGNWRGRRRGMPPAPRPFVPVSLKCWSHLIHSSTLILKIFGRDLAQCECLYPSLTNSTRLRTVFFSHTKKNPKPNQTKIPSASENGSVVLHIWTTMTAEWTSRATPPSRQLLPTLPLYLSLTRSHVLSISPSLIGPENFDSRPQGFVCHVKHVESVERERESLSEWAFFCPSVQGLVTQGKVKALQDVIATVSVSSGRNQLCEQLTLPFPCRTSL